MIIDLHSGKRKLGGCQDRGIIGIAGDINSTNEAIGADGGPLEIGSAVLAIAWEPSCHICSWGGLG